MWGRRHCCRRQGGRCWRSRRCSIFVKYCHDACAPAQLPGLQRVATKAGRGCQTARSAGPYGPFRHPVWAVWQACGAPAPFFRGFCHGLSWPLRPCCLRPGLWRLWLWRLAAPTPLSAPAALAGVASGGCLGAQNVVSGPLLSNVGIFSTIFNSQLRQKSLFLQALRNARRVPWHCQTLFVFSCNR